MKVRQKQLRPVEAQSDPLKDNRRPTTSPIGCPSETGRTIIAFEQDIVDEVAEIFSPPKVVTIARANGIEGGWSIDRLIKK